MKRTIGAQALPFLFFVLVPGAPLSGWGPDGHRAVAILASERLSGQARRQVSAILANESMSDERVAIWADGVRNTTHSHTYNWHFVNIPIASTRYDKTRHCRPAQRGDCIVEALFRLERDLRNPLLSPTQRREALLFMIHLVGDLHQPLHAGDNSDRGGNDRSVKAIGGSENLHGAWDSGIITASGLNAEALCRDARKWLRTQNPKALSKGLYGDWAMESAVLARDVVYPQVNGDNVIDDSERKAALGLIEQRIGAAGVRLAAVLNRIFEKQ